MNDMSIVVWDPTGRHHEGELIGRQQAVLLANKGIAMLPIDPSLLRRSGAGGWIKRSWGAGAEPLSSRRFCLVTICISASASAKALYWKARLVRIAEPANGQEASTPRGTLTLSADSSQPGISSTVGVGQESPPVHLHMLGAADKYNGWTVGGKLRLNASREGFLGLSFFSVASGVKVRWLAVSQASV
jgi:hypothetical protein